MLPILRWLKSTSMAEGAMTSWTDTSPRERRWDGEGSVGGAVCGAEAEGSAGRVFFEKRLSEGNFMPEFF